jgi:hypothetical protein
MLISFEIVRTITNLAQNYRLGCTPKLKMWEENGKDFFAVIGKHCQECCDKHGVPPENMSERPRAAGFRDCTYSFNIRCNEATKQNPRLKPKDIWKMVKDEFAGKHPEGCILPSSKKVRRLYHYHIIFNIIS